MTASRMLRYAAALAGVVSVLAGCAATSPRPAPALLADRVGHDPSAAACARWMADMDRAVDGHGVRDVQSVEIAGYPYLRVNRTLVELAPVPASGPRFDTWVSRMHRLDRDARLHELSNLPAASRRALDVDGDAGARLARCGERLVETDLASPARRQALRERVRVRDDYLPWMRAAGLYPLTSIPFLAGVAALHEDIARPLGQPPSALRVRGVLVRYAPPGRSSRPDDGAAAAHAASMPRDSLGIPVPAERDLVALFERHAPVWEVDRRTDDDRIGAPAWVHDARAEVEVSDPVTYRLVSHARAGNSVLLQLNYAIWFPARTASGAVNLLAGHMDGIIWRVTLGPHGRPVLFDTVHGCGCYHMVVTTPRARARPPPARYEEPILVAGEVPDGPGRVVIRLASGTHYVENVYRDHRESPAERYRFEDYDVLRSLPVPGGGRRSLFGPDALVAGTERAERWLFWPMGVASPGAMRQWGHHAIAFVGRRHFDDPGLMARYFRIGGLQGEAHHGKPE